MMKRFMTLLLTILFLLPTLAVSAEDVAISEYRTVNGVRCRERQNILTYLLIGVDDEGPAKPKESYDGHGQCDVLMLLVIDKAEDTYAIVSINRDTVTPVHTLTEDGQDLGAYPVQISLAHANGDGILIY